eukprot:COSAG01_NODE_3530_length_5964_cov_653.329241_8_plen_77_part_00
MLLCDKLVLSKLSHSSGRPGAPRLACTHCDMGSASEANEYAETTAANTINTLADTLLKLAAQRVTHEYSCMCHTPT